MPRSKRSKKSRPIVSSILDSVACAQVAPEMKQLEESTVAYYHNLSSAEMEEESDWGRVGAEQLLRPAHHASDTLSF